MTAEQEIQVPNSVPWDRKTN